MTRAILLCASLLIALGGVSLVAQEPPGQGKGPVAGTASQDQPRIPLLESIATLEKSLDTKKLKVGDEVGFKLGQDLMSGRDIVVAKDSRLVGHVAELKSHQSDHPGTWLTIVFDRIVKKDGVEMPVYGVVQSVRGTKPTPGEYESSRQQMGQPSAPKRITDDGRVVSTGRPQDIPGPPISASQDSARRTSAGDGTKDVMVITERSPQGLKAALVSDKDDITLSAGTVIVVKLVSRP